MDNSDLWYRLAQMRPMILGDALVRIFGPRHRRKIVTTVTGVKLYVDPLTGFGHAAASDAGYEPEVAILFKRVLRPSDRVLDVGANEGYYSALAGGLVGPAGFIVAVEPQRALTDIIGVNAALNGVTWIKIFQNGVGGEEGTPGTLKLYPSFNTGAASVTNGYRFSWKREPFRYISFATLLAASGGSCFDLVKVDVEGYEPEVLRHFMPNVASGQIRRLLLDYAPILLKRNVDPRALHDQLIANGMRVEEGDPANLSSYILYARAEAP